MTLWRRFAILAAVNTGSAVLALLFKFMFRHDAPWGYYWTFLQSSLVYAWCIGTLCSTVMHFAGPRLWSLGARWRYPALALAFAGLAAMGCLLAAGGLVLIGLEKPAEFWGEFTSSLRIGMALTVVIGVSVTAFQVLTFRLRAAHEELQRQQLAEERARKLAMEARLSSLESRIHPHFLFNTLNSISALVREDPAKAERTVERLAALLRYSLDIAGRQLVPLRQELCIVRDYLEIEKTRFGDRLRYRIAVPADLEDLDVPPMSLQLLVENSIKHAVSVNRQGGEVVVTARRAGDELLLTVDDDGPGFDLQAIRQGHGLDNLEERLAALFEGGGGLEFHRADGRMAVEIRVPCRRVAA